jgi:DNA-binding transcriptional MerR regulator
MQGLLRSVDVVAELRVHPSTLRRYERRGLVTPLRNHNGVRFYSLEQVEQLRMIVSPQVPDETRPNEELPGQK